MRTNLMANAILFLASTLIAIEGGEQGKTDDCDSVSVPMITDVQIKYDGMKSIEITATGMVPTGGYKDHSLVRRAYFVAPSDGIWEYDLLTCKPNGIVSQVITPVTAKDKWESPPANLKGIRVVGAKGSKEVPIKWPRLCGEFVAM